MTVLGVIILCVFLILITQRWFWALAFLLGALASCFAMIASVIHFQILGAMGFFVLMLFLFSCMAAVSGP